MTWSIRLALLGPAFVAAVAYVDPGNFATNIQSGAQYGYQLVWVIIMANLMAVLVQYLSAKLGLVTGHNLAELLGMSPRRWSRRLFWIQAELIAMATDLAEFIGAALGLHLIFNIGLFSGGLITAVLAFAILGLQQKGYRPFERAIVVLLAVVAIGFTWDTIAIGHQSVSNLAQGLVPQIPHGDALTLTIGIIGATVMPHVIYLHSALTQQRIKPTDQAHIRRLLRWIKIDCALGLGAAGVVNLLMLVVSAALFHRLGHTGIDNIQAAHQSLDRLVGGGAALVFAVTLLASGLSSSSVGTYAGQVIMAGLLHRRISLALRRAITMIPALVVLALGVSVTHTLVLSQVALSFGIPFALIPLLILTSRAHIMGPQKNTRTTIAVAGLVATVITALNLVLLWNSL